MRTKTLLLLLLVAMSAISEEMHVKVSTLGAPWIVPVSQTATYVRTLRVETNRKITLTMDVTTPFLGDITGEEIPVTFNPETKTLVLEPGIPQLVRITFTKVSHAELYRGVIQFRGTSPVRKILDATLQLDARMRPELIAPPLRKFSRVRDAGFLARTLLGDVAGESKIELRVHSNKPQRIQLRAKDAVIVGEKSGREAGCVITESTCENVSGDLGVVRVALNLDLANLPPDNYTGSVLLLSTEPDALAVSVPIEIAVRAAPLIPLLVIVFGVIVGIVAKWMEDKGNRQADLLIRLERVRNALQPGDLRTLSDLFDKARQYIYLADLANAETAVGDLETRADAVQRIDRWTEDLRTSGVTAPDLLGELEKARVAMLVNPDQQKLADLETQVHTALAQIAVSPGERAATRRGAPIASRVASWWDAFLRWRAESAPLIRGALYLLTVLALIYAGLQTLYVANPTFGANHLGDYASLFFWGLGADVAGKTLSGVGSLVKR
ncbi:MAG TPA: hypothetical protein VFO89_02235 [Thermoanaerobaculia bacterium]|nr:hypothetical protein [Thermoanaerobaculia bacterium]